MDMNVANNFLGLYDQLIDNGISIVYLGEFNHEITKMFTSMAEQEMEKISEDRFVRKIVYHTLIETLQNMNRHANEVSDEEAGRGVFMVGKKDDVYNIITINRVKNDKVENLKSALDQVNGMNREELKLLYKKQLQDGEISRKGGAGLGLIDMARKSFEKLEYQLIPKYPTAYLFILKVSINPHKIIKDREENPSEFRMLHSLAKTKDIAYSDL